MKKPIRYEYRAKNFHMNKKCALLRGLAHAKSIKTSKSQEYILKRLNRRRLAGLFFENILDATN